MHRKRDAATERAAANAAVTIDNDELGEDFELAMRSQSYFTPVAGAGVKSG
jgi:hypothetical protein